ncbi:uncharacterized protein L203_102884 [Cryptococcus depauperatus CBS 7841]|uniref:C2H2-type domain-containing protein n=1 Tax=Cryptococcus depauperatus CBS 7841 TaxID=1295531 RepID=A0AAJ8JSM5_9TREE
MMGEGNQFSCEHPGCAKSFTRKDHLIRHAANHSQVTYHCPKCNRGFKRQDLLQRHEARNICGDDAPNTSTSIKRQRSISDAPGKPRSNGHRQLAPASLETTAKPTSSTPPSAATSVSVFPVTSITSTATTSSSASLEQTGTQISSQTDYHPANNFIVSDFMGDWGFSLWAPEQWEALLHESLPPSFNETMVDMTLNMPMVPRLQQESAERGQDGVASAMLVARLQRSYPEFDVPLSWVIDSLQNYWTRTAPTFPFIHRGTFDLDTAPTELIVMMSVIGSVHMTPRRDFGHLVSKIRGYLVQGCGFEMPITTLQTFCLCHVHDTWYGTVESQFVAQCMWPVMVAHSRKKGIGVTDKPEFEPQQEEAWATWAKEEERRRAAYCVLLIDTQLSAFWNQHCSRQLSIFAHHLTLPCTRRQWEAPSAQKWFRTRAPITNTPPTPRKNNQRSGYLPGLHPEFQVTSVSDGYSAAVLAALSLEKFSFKVDMDNSMTVQMVLIGLIAIAWDCRTRGGMGIRFREGTKHWRSIVFKAVIALRAAYEQEVVRMGDAVESKDLRDTFSICIISILSDIPMLCVAAGASIFCGSTIGPRQYADAKRRLKLWAQTEDAWTCVWQCARYLRQSLFAEWGLYTPWAVFLTTLVCWAYSWSYTCEETAPIPHSSVLPHSSRLTSSTTQNIHTVIVAWLDRILQAQGRLDTLDDEIKQMMEYVARQLEIGESTARENGALLKRLATRLVVQS